MINNRDSWTPVILFILKVNVQVIQFLFLKGTHVVNLIVLKQYIKTSKETSYSAMFNRYYSLCKLHFCKLIRIILAKELRKLYKSPQDAYGSIDFTGKGFITEQDFLQSLVIQRVKIT
jgi:hypothetical protein